jgi:hypothetical protein
MNQKLLRAGLARSAGELPNLPAFRVADRTRAVAWAAVLLAVSTVGSGRSANATPILVAGWNFNNANLTVSHGAGTMTTDVNGFNFSNSGTNPSVNGTTLNAVAGDPAGRRLQAPPRFLGQNQGGRYLQFDLDLTGYQDVGMSWAMFVVSGYTNANTIQYRVGNSGAFTTFGTFTPPSGEGNWAVRSADFSSVPAIDNQSIVQFRLVLPSTGDWNAGAFYDNVQFNALAVPEPATAGLAVVFGLGSLGLLRYGRRRVS